MSYIVLIRAQNGHLLAMPDSRYDDGTIAEYGVYDDAGRAAENNMLCQACGYVITDAEV